MELTFSLGELFTCGAFVLTFYEICKASKTTMAEKYTELRLEAYNNFIKLFGAYPTKDFQTNKYRAILSSSYHRVIMLTPAEYHCIINDFYRKYVTILDNLDNNDVHNPSAADLALSRNEVITLFQKILLLYDPYSHKISVSIKNIFKKK